MSQASLAAAKIYVKLCEDINYKDTFANSREPYRAIVDLARTTHVHNIVDGSDDYHSLIDFLESLLCD